MKAFFRFFGGVLLYIVTTLIIVVLGLYGALQLAVFGPSEHFRDVFVSSMMESSAGPIAIRLVLPDEQIEQILSKNTTVTVDDITDTSLVTVMANEARERAQTAAATAEELENNPDPDGDGIEIHEISGPMYHGVMMIVYDPSRVICATIDNYTHSSAGMTLEALINKYGAVAGVNGGRYEDESGLGIGGWPEGIVISQGVLRSDGIEDPNEQAQEYGTDTAEGTETTETEAVVTSFPTVGFNNDDILVVGTMGAGYAMSIGLRDAVSFGPALIVNGVSAQYSGSSGGLNPRTAIGQREDGAVLLLCIEGRKTSSMGATMADLIEVMEEYGAVNAFNLDGGMSSSMIYNGEELVRNAQLRQDRAIPTAFVVLPQESED